MSSLLGTIKLAGVLLLAIPAALAGLEFLFVRGETAIGAGLLGLAVALVLVQRSLSLPTDVKGLVAKRLLGRAVPGPEEPTESDE